MADRPRNPFTVRTPEDLAAAEAAGLFVDVFTDFYKIRERGHAMLNGPRGSGKSMMFRYLAPDCLRIAEKRPIEELDFFAVLISIKNAELNLTELRTLSGKSLNAVLNEHFLAMFVASKFFSYVATLDLDESDASVSEMNSFVSDVVNDRLLRCGLPEQRLLPGRHSSLDKAFRDLGDLFDRLYQDVVQYIRRLFPNSPGSQFSGPLCGYLDFLHPVLRAMSRLPFMPSSPIYLLMDDADTLSDVQTRVLNSWVATRTSHDVSIKISTQMRYKTFSTVSGGLIETPHDYSEVNIADLYTTNRSKYRARVREIVARRLGLANVDVTPEAFFPPYAPQEARVEAIAKEIRRGEHEVSGRGYRLSDDVYRYARPIYMKSLSGSRKASSQYSYAGFDQLVHISSGLIRHFLEAATLMYSDQRAGSDEPVERIDPGVQDHEIGQMANLLMTSEFDKIAVEENANDSLTVGRPEFVEQKRRLRNLIEALGGTFRQKLLSDDSERRVFSIALSNEPSEDVVAVLDLGVKYGYFQRSTIGNKEGTGRTGLYILTRRVAPYFKLDPSGFAGYLFVTSENVRAAMLEPRRLLRRVQKKGVTAAFGELAQRRLFQ